MRTPEQVIAAGIRYDHRATSNAVDIVTALKAEGYEIVPTQPSLPEMQRVFGEPA